jgi:hypothetical protein
MASGSVLGILVGGGPAPGINAVISAATIEAINEGFQVLGILRPSSQIKTPASCCVLQPYISNGIRLVCS